MGTKKVWYAKEHLDNFIVFVKGEEKKIGSGKSMPQIILLALKGETDQGLANEGDLKLSTIKLDSRDVKDVGRLMRMYGFD